MFLFQRLDHVDQLYSKMLKSEVIEKSEKKADNY